MYMESTEKKLLILEDLWGIYKLPEPIHITARECKYMLDNRNFFLERESTDCIVFSSVLITS